MTLRQATQTTSSMSRIPRIRSGPVQFSRLTLFRFQLTSCPSHSSHYYFSLLCYSFSWLFSFLVLFYFGSFSYLFFLGCFLFHFCSFCSVVLFVLLFFFILSLFLYLFVFFFLFCLLFFIGLFDARRRLQMRKAINHVLI